MKRMIWTVLGFATSLILSGCLEGKYGYEGSGAYPYKVTRASDPVWKSSDLMSSAGIHALNYPLGAHGTDRGGIYSNTVGVHNEAELESALVVPSNIFGREIIIMNAIVVDHSLRVSGNVAISAVDSHSILSFTSGGFEIETQSSTSPTVRKNLSCTSPTQAFWAAATSLSLSIIIDGKVSFTGSGPLHLIIGDVVRNAAPGVSVSLPGFDLQMNGPVLIVPDEMATRHNPWLEGAGQNAWGVVRSQNASPNFDSAGIMGSQVMVVDSVPSEVGPYIDNQQNCRNLVAGQEYERSDYNGVQEACARGSWIDLTNSFAACGGGQ